jgi:hypothetical protein
MPMSDSRRQRQQLICVGDMALLRDEVEEDLELLELVESVEVAEEALAPDCSGSAEGRWAAAVWSCSSREASGGLDMNPRCVWRRASRGWVGSEKVDELYSETGVISGVSVLKWADEAGTTMLK